MCCADSTATNVMVLTTNSATVVCLCGHMIRQFFTCTTTRLGFFCCCASWCRESPIYESSVCWRTPEPIQRACAETYVHGTVQWPALARSRHCASWQMGAASGGRQRRLTIGEDCRTAQEVESERARRMSGKRSKVVALGFHWLCWERRLSVGSEPSGISERQNEKGVSLIHLMFEIGSGL